MGLLLDGTMTDAGTVSVRESSPSFLVCWPQDEKILSYFSSDMVTPCILIVSSFQYGSLRHQESNWR
jgi:hypothetical protein